MGVDRLRAHTDMAVYRQGCILAVPERRAFKPLGGTFGCLLRIPRDAEMDEDPDSVYNAMALNLLEADLTGTKYLLNSANKQQTLCSCGGNVHMKQVSVCDDALWILVGQQRWASPSCVTEKALRRRYG